MTQQTKGKRVVVVDAIFPDLADEQAAASACGAEFSAHQCSSASQVEDAVAGADVAVVQFAPMARRAIEGLAPGARIIRYGVGYDNIDCEAAAETGRTVAYVPDYCTEEVSDHTATLILAALRKVAALDSSVRAGRWSAVDACRPMKAFSDSRIGFVGLGRIGRAVMERLRPFGFSFIVFDPALNESALDELGARKATDVEAVFAESDALALHVPSMPETRYVVDERTLALMKPTAVVVNTARGDLIDAHALADALTAGRLAGAALDVFDREPLPQDSPLRKAPNLILSPHAAWYSDTAIGRLQSLVADEIRRGLEGEPPRCPVPVLRSPETA